MHLQLSGSSKTDRPPLLGPLRCVDSKRVLGVVQYRYHDGDFINECM